MATTSATASSRSQAEGSSGSPGYSPGRDDAESTKDDGDGMAKGDGMARGDGMAVAATRGEAL